MHNKVTWSKWQPNFNEVRCEVSKIDMKRTNTQLENKRYITTYILIYSSNLTNNSFSNESTVQSDRVIFYLIARLKSCMRISR